MNHSRTVKETLTQTSFYLLALFVSSALLFACQNSNNGNNGTYSVSNGVCVNGSNQPVAMSNCAPNGYYMCNGSCYSLVGNTPGAGYNPYTSYSGYGGYGATSYYGLPMNYGGYGYSGGYANPYGGGYGGYGYSAYPGYGYSGYGYSAGGACGAGMPTSPSFCAGLSGTPITQVCNGYYYYPNSSPYPAATGFATSYGGSQQVLCSGAPSNCSNQFMVTLQGQTVRCQ